MFRRRFFRGVKRGRRATHTFRSHAHSGKTSGVMVNIGRPGQRYLHANLNPFGLGTVGPKAFHANVPDGNGGQFSSSFVLTAELSVTGSASIVDGLITVNVPNVNVDGTNANYDICQNAAIFVAGTTSGAEIGSTGTWGTGCHGAVWHEATTFNACVAQHKRIRIVGWGLRVYATSASDNTQGLFSAALSPLGIAASATDVANPVVTYVTTPIATAFTPFQIEEGHALQGAGSGIMVRRGYDSRDHEYSAQPTTCMYTSAGLNYEGLGVRPMIKFEGLSTTTVIRIETVIHIEAEVSNATFPGYVCTGDSEPHFESIKSYANHVQYVTSAGGPYARSVTRVHI